MRKAFALFLIANYHAITPATAQIDSKIAQKAVCMAASEVTQADMLGLWRAEFAGVAQGATLLLEKSTEFNEGLAGGINRDGVKSQVAGDVDNGAFTLEESADGTSIAANWAGNIMEPSCGKEIRGVWTSTQGDQRAFVLRKATGW